MKKKTKTTQEIVDDYLFGIRRNPGSEFTGVAWTAMCQTDLINELIDLTVEGVSTDEIAEMIEAAWDDEYPFKDEKSIYSDLLDEALAQVDYIKLARTLKSYVKRYGREYF